MPSDEIDRYTEERERETRLRNPPRSLLARGSIAVRKKIWDEEAGEWREVVRFSRRKFDNDAAKGTFLEQFATHGRMGEAAAAAGVSTQTVRKAVEDDEDFAEAVMMAEESYREKLISHHQDLLFNGTEKITYGKEGQIVARERIYPIRLIELELKKHDKGYREKQEVDITHKGGVMIAPAETKTIDDWESRFAKAIDVTPTPSAEED